MNEPTYKPGDQQELDRFKREVTRRNAHLIDRDIGWLREMRLYEVNLYDPYVQTTITNSFHFLEERAAQAAVNIARKLCGED